MVTRGKYYKFPESIKCVWVIISLSNRNIQLSAYIDLKDTYYHAKFFVWS